MSSKNFINRQILLVRHGRTSWNDAHRFQGRTDIPLNEAGIAQAERLAERLAPWPLDAVWSSPLLRTRQTAAAVASRHGMEPRVLDELVEVNFGPWEGMHLKTLREQEHDQLRAWMKDPFFHGPEGSETWEAIRARVQRAMEIILKDAGERVVVVSHGGIMRALFVVLLDLDPHSVWNIKTSNCAISGIEVREYQTSLTFSNDDLHLRIAEGVSMPVW